MSLVSGNVPEWAGTLGGILGHTPSQQEIEYWEPYYYSKSWDWITGQARSMGAITLPPPLVSLPGVNQANLSLGDITGGLNDLLDIAKKGIGIFGGSSGPPPLQPPGGWAPAPTGAPAPVGLPPGLPGPTTMGMGGMLPTIGKAAGAIGGAIGRSKFIRSTVGGIVGYYVFDKLMGWIFKPGNPPHKHMNVLNPRALKRANKRMEGFRGVATKALRELGYKVERSGAGCRPRAARRNHRPGCKCFACR